MKSPIVIVEDRDISVHPSPEHAEAFLEPIDVKAGNYIGYDSEGNLLDLSVVPAEKQHGLLLFKWTTRSNVIRIKLRQPPENREEDLKNKLRQYLENRENKKIKSQLSIRELIQMISKYMPWRLDA